MDVVGTILRLSRPLVPRRFRESVRRHIAPTSGSDFRICSPATAPELAHCLIELKQDGLLEGGSYYEFGVFRGYALWFVEDMTRRLGVKDFHCHGFDSFRGMPAPTGVGDEGAPWRAGTFAVSRGQVEEYLREFNADFSRISLHEGFFSDELFASFKGTANFRRAALVLIDCDLYSSTVPVLEFIRDYLADGTIVLFDDYNCFNASDERGQRRALNEFLAKNPSFSAQPLRPFGWHGQGFRFRHVS